MTDEEYERRDALVAEDRHFFSRHPDRDFRLRRTDRSEMPGPRPAGLEVFSILHRHDIGDVDAHHHFPAPIEFETNVDDAAIRAMLAERFGRTA